MFLLATMDYLALLQSSHNTKLQYERLKLDSHLTEKFVLFTLLKAL